ncbi:MAG: murein transglycosylase [Rhodospirillales bacterium CG15_BIG_FIL_POST_REV_8_21_14_020_66_15]|nr:MAG: murein transglycosylase [Rhodospirillales bacterium CG15_BIG_FIL_POST_REV_8_21_14_020_66_15]
MIRAGTLALAVLVSGLVSGCGLLPAGDAPPPAAPAARLILEPAEFKTLPGWRTDALADGLAAFLASCPVLARQPADQPLGYLPEHGTMGDLQRICEEVRTLDSKRTAQLQFFMERSFRPFRVRDGQTATGKFTGYYEPLLRGSWQPDARYRHPVYSRPRDIVVVDMEKFDPERRGEQLAGRVVDDRLVPYYDRREIAGGALRGRQLELLWVDSAVDLFFLHVQGSGRIQLPDGSHLRLAFSGRNGHRYSSIGRELVAQGVMKVEDVTMPSLRAWMAANPLAAEQLMLKNRSFIFFRVEPDGVVKGAMGVPLTAGRSLAVDPEYVPLGLPLWLATTDPLDPKNEKPLTRMVVAQDTGSAITGVIRGDLFWGFGAEAEARAGLMNEGGTYYLLLPRKPLH